MVGVWCVGGIWWDYCFVDVLRYGCFICFCFVCVGWE